LQASAEVAPTLAYIVKPKVSWTSAKSAGCSLFHSS
jgi:hypothetical protein